MVNGLAQLTLKLGSPGVPDIYQGAELWDLSLVDPDNRRPVDFELRKQMLDEIDAIRALPTTDRVAAVASLVEWWQDGRIKLLLTAVGLHLRRNRPDLFRTGRYVPLVTEAAVSSDILAFARMPQESANGSALFIAPRLVAPLVPDALTVPLGGDTWKTSRILLPRAFATATFTNALTGEQLQPASTADEAWLFAGQVFSTAPVAILTTADG
jgi:(1->4)-alpha-D-glucan 1-alpha-D-glucosylmutase